MWEKARNHSRPDRRIAPDQIRWWAEPAEDGAPTSSRIRASLVAPMPRTSASVAASTARIRSIEPNRLRSRCASAGPTPGSPCSRRAASMRGVSASDRIAGEFVHAARAPARRGTGASVQTVQNRTNATPGSAISPRSTLVRLRPSEGARPAATMAPDLQSATTIGSDYEPISPPAETGDRR
jgi:hypothetical protein